MTRQAQVVSPGLLSTLLWAGDELPRAIRSALNTHESVPWPAAPLSETSESWDPWFDQVSRILRHQCRRLSVRIGELDRLLRTGRLVIRIGNEFLVVQRSSGPKTRLIARDGRTIALPTERLVQLLEERLVPPAVTAEADRWLELAEVPEKRKEEARGLLLRGWDEGVRIEDVWIFDPPQGESLWNALRTNGTLSDLAAFFLVHALAYALFILAWKGFGNAALSGSLSSSLTLGWVWLFLASFALQSLRNALQGRASIRGVSSSSPICSNELSVRT